MSAKGMLVAMLAGTVLVMLVGARRSAPEQPVPPPAWPPETPWLSREAAAQLVGPGGRPGRLFADMIGCAQLPTEGEPGPASPKRERLPMEAKPGDDDDERARMIREAEDFVRAQGYTDAPPSVFGDAIVREWIEGSLEDRRGLLEPRAHRAYASGGEWIVVFRYRDPKYAERGRALKMRAGQTPAFRHQDQDLDFMGPSTNAA
jgi:hypothetical protein